MRIAVSAKQLDMPPLCACCGEPSSTTIRVSATRVQGKRVVRTKTSAWSFPFCMRCGEHDREWPAASGFEVLVLTLLTCGLYLYFYVKRRQRALAMCTPACARPTRAVAYLGWHGTVHQFEVGSEVFARAFMTSNARKIVDADAAARGVMSKPAGVSLAPPRVPYAPPPPADASRANEQQRPSAPRAVEPQRRPPPPVPPPRPLASSPIADGFHGPHDSVTVAGRTLQGPLAYVMRDERNADASTIITSLRVTTSLGAEPLPYWPTYAGASPAQRAVYLDWHASGRCDPEIAIDYVFVHFYGLERRVLVDGRDHEIVLAELKRLLAIYGGSSRSFRGYATSLMAFLALPALGTLSEYAVYAHLGEIADDNPIALAGLLAWFHIHGRPLPPSGAMLVADSMEGAKRGAVVKRARNELANLFTIRYRERFGDGMRLDAAKRPEVIPYHPGSPTLLSAARQIRISVPHVLGKPSQFDPLVGLWNDCVADLKKLSFARRDDKGSGPLTREAWHALPPELRADYDHPDQEAWDEAIKAAPRTGAFHLLAAGRLAALAGIEVDERVTGARLRRAVEAAAALGYAVEPDARVAAKTVPVSTELAVWRTKSADAPDAMLWKSVHTMLSLTLSVALADGELAEEEGRSVDGLIEDLFALDDTMRTRVAALREILTRQPARATTIAKKLKDTHGPGALAKIGRVLVAVAAVDGVIVDKEYKSLESLYKTMGLAATELAAAIAASGARLATDAPVRVKAARPGAAGEAIPPPPEETPKLDAPAIAAILAETREVALLLAEVLDDDDEEPSERAGVAGTRSSIDKPPAKGAPRASSNGAWSTLDARYHEVLRELLTRSVWTAAEVRAIATRAKMMPGAILETLNGWSEERFGDYVIEEAGDWRIHAAVLERPIA